ncbi:MAG TPA: hypothetical protein DCX54_03195 [Flavobacteriales bacterium]|nr:hypothetical protein [Flavobacteriales bacterium]
MLTRIFSTNRVFIFAFLPFVLFILRGVSVFNSPPVQVSGQFPWIADIFFFINQYSSLNVILTVGLITVQAYYLARICDQQRLFHQTSNLPGFILAINYSLFTAFNYLSPALVANLFLILAMQRIMSVYNQAYVIPVLFRAGFYIGIAGVFYKPSLFFFILISYQLFISRTFNWREYLIPFLAMLLPFFYLYSYYFLYDDDSTVMNWFGYGQQYFLEESKGMLPWLAPIMASLITLIALGNLLSTSLKRTSRTNNLYKWLFSAMVLGFILTFFFTIDVHSSLLLSLPAVSIIQSYFFLGIRKNWIREALVYLVIGVIVIRELTLI